MMQKSPWKLVAGVLVASAVMIGAVQAAEVASNIVGYVKVEMPAGGIYLLSTPFDQVDGTANTVDKVLGDQLPANSVVFAWNGASYDSSNNLPFGWSPPDLDLARGTGWWVSLEAESITEDQSVLIMGEVPESDITIALTEGDNLVGNPVPVEMLLSVSGLATAPDSTVAFFWNGASYDSANKLVFGWSPDSALAIGEGFWLTLPAGSSFDWMEPAP